MISTLIVEKTASCLIYSFATGRKGGHVCRSTWPLITPKGKRPKGKQRKV